MFVCLIIILKALTKLLVMTLSQVKIIFLLSLGERFILRLVKTATNWSHVAVNICPDDIAGGGLLRHPPLPPFTTDNLMENISKCNKPRCVAFLVYPSSDQLNDIMGFIDNLKHQIEYDGFQGFISPLHLPDEEDKVSHLHCVLVRPPRKGFEIGTWRGICSHYGAANGFVLVPSAPSGYCQYLLHRNNPDKQQFDEQHPVTSVGGLDYNLCCTPSYWGEKVNKLKEPVCSFADIIEFINSYETDSYAELIDLLLLEHPDWVDFASSKSHSLLNYLKSRCWSRKYDSANKSGYNEAIGKVLRIITHNPQYFTDSLSQQQLISYISDNL